MCRGADGDFNNEKHIGTDKRISSLHLLHPANGTSGIEGGTEAETHPGIFGKHRGEFECYFLPKSISRVRTMSVFFESEELLHPMMNSPPTILMFSGS